MKNLQEIQKLYQAFNAAYGMNIENAPQGSEAWFNLKLGVLSASNANKIVAKKGTQTRQTYLNQLLAQVCTGQHKDMDSAALSWGRAVEDQARATYEMQEDTEIVELPFVFKDASFREGCSPDGIDGWQTGVEIKAPYASENHIAFMVDGKIKPEWQWQMQYCMRILDCETYHFVSFDPRMRKGPIAIQIVDRDNEMQKKLNDAVPEFLLDMDKALGKLGFQWGDQWRN